MASGDSQIHKPRHGYPRRAELPDVNINTGVQSIILRAYSLNPAKLYSSGELGTRMSFLEKQ